MLKTLVVSLFLSCAVASAATPAPGPAARAAAWRSVLAGLQRGSVPAGMLHGVLLRQPLIPEALHRECWSRFFRDTIVDIGRQESERPVALFYNPLVDVAVLVEIVPGGSGDVVPAIAVLPGEILGGGQVAEGRPGPAWLEAADPFTALGRTVQQRLRAFSALHPYDAARPAAALPPRPVSSAERAAAEVRILEHVRALVRLAAKRGVLDQALAAARVRAPSVAPRLEISAAYPAGGSGGIVLVSLPDDGHRFALVALPTSGPAAGPSPSVAFVDLLEDPS